MGDRVAVLKDGILQQCDTPRTMYDTPANVFVAGFIGSPQMNLVEATLVDGGVKLGERVVPIDRAKADAAAAEGAKTVTLGFRPEDLWITDGSTGVPVTAIVRRRARRRRATSTASSTWVTRRWTSSSG